MKRTLIILTAAIFSITLNAQTKAEKVNELIQIMHSDKMMSDMFDQMSVVFKKQAKKQLNKDCNEAFNKFMFEELKTVMKQMNSVEFPMIYDKHFTEHDIDELLVFYKSPVGQKMIEKTPAVQKDLMVIMMEKYIPQLQQKFTAKIKALKESEENS